jgi:hypothetical protein
MSVGEDSSHASIIAQINEDVVKGARRVPVDGEGPIGVPEPHERPDENAQWDEVHGRWVDWDEKAQAWVPSPVPSPPAPDAADPETATPADEA